MKSISFAALLAAAALAAPALAQTPPATTAPNPTSPSSTAPQPAAPSSSASTGSTADTAANAGASTEIISGMSVKDSTGALIGEVTSVKAGVATIKMGSDTFQVDTNKLGVQGGAATINATQADIKKMMPKK